MTDKLCPACEGDHWPKDDEGRPLERFWIGDGSGPYYIDSHHALLRSREDDLKEAVELLQKYHDYASGKIVGGKREVWEQAEALLRRLSDASRSAPAVTRESRG